MTSKTPDAPSLSLVVKHDSIQWLGLAFLEPDAGLEGRLKAAGYRCLDDRGKFDAVLFDDCDAVAVGPGWEGSARCRAYVAVAQATGKPVLDAETGDRLSDDLDVPVKASQASETIKVVPLPTTASGEVRVTSGTGGAKGSKAARFDLIPPGPLEELAVLYGRGAIKYNETNEDANWKRGYAWSLSYAALLRHLQLWWQRTEDHDEEMGVKHLINVAWHAFNLAWFMENRPEFDDRPQGSKLPDGSHTGEKYEGALPEPAWVTEKRAASR